MPLNRMPPTRASLYRDRLRPALVAALLRVLALGLARLSWPAAQRCGRGVGALIWWCGRRDRRRALHHLELAFPDLPAGERRGLARACFRHHGINLAECLHLLGRDGGALLAVVEFEGWEEVERVVAAGRPLVLITGHCGNWELLGAAFNCRGLPVTVVARPLDAAPLQRLLNRFRERFGTPAVSRGSLRSARRLLSALRCGGALGMLIDQDTLKVESVWVPFFGRPARTPVGAVKIALRQQAAVIPTFIERQPSGRHRIRILPPVTLPPEPQRATALLTEAIEQQVRRCPEQWVWMHRRWRRQPPPAAPEAARRPQPRRQPAPAPDAAGHPYPQPPSAADPAGQLQAQPPLPALAPPAAAPAAPPAAAARLAAPRAGSPQPL
jgi:KDO2-lipid IV(A) lauroyltransferase